jgi:hypothetical protein
MLESKEIEELKNISEIAQHVYFWVVVVLGGVAFAIYGLYRWFRGLPSSTEEVAISKAGNDRSYLIRYARSLTCVVVDDRLDDFPIDFMRRFFKSVSTETLVSLNDAERLAGFDVVFLDVAGVVSEDVQRGGAVLIERLRQHRSEGILISVSSKKYDVEVTRYFEVADIRIRKPVLAAAVEEQILAHIDNRAGPVALAKVVDRGVRRVVGRWRHSVLAREVARLAEGDLSIVPPAIVERAGVSAQYVELIRSLRRIRNDR